MSFGRTSALGLAITIAASALPAQERGAAQLHLLVDGLTVTPRALVIGVRPDDDDGQLLAWLARGRNVETGFLSLTRGESGINYLGTESGTPLGAIRTQEALAARRVDGAEQFFTRAYDFGFARDAAEAFGHWPRDSILAHIVVVIRSFRPQVMVTTASRGAGPDAGEYMALDTLAREAFDAALDTVRFPVRPYGQPWGPLSLYRHGSGLTIDPNEFDVVLGDTYTDIAERSRAQRRSEGFTGGLLGRAGKIRLERVASRVGDSTTSHDEKSLFSGIDTSFARLSAGRSPELAATLASIAAEADSARAMLDLAHPERIVPHLARLSRLASSVRAAVPWCSHPALDAAPPAVVTTPCNREWLDLDASIDLVRKRAADAVFLAAGVSFEATVDRELVAEGDTALATVTLYNFGKSPVTLADVVIPGGPITSPRTIVVPPDSLARAYRRVTGVVNAQPWWIGTGRDGALFPLSSSAVDGLSRRENIASSFRVIGAAVAEELRRQTDVSVSVQIAGVTVTKSLGPLVFRYADANVGMQERTPSGVPAVTLEFDHSLEWVPANKPINRSLRLAVKSFSDAEQTLKFKIYSPPGVHVDSVPTSITLSPHEQRDVAIHLRGVLKPGRFEFGVVGSPENVAPLPSSPRREMYAAGFQTVQYNHLPPVRLFHSSGLYLQAVDITIPSQLGVLYVKGVLDDIPAALKQIGIAAFAVQADELLGLDLSRMTTIVLGRSAYELHPELIAQNSRLMEFVRGGGTLVVEQSGAGTLNARVLPYPINLRRIAPERVSSPAAQVTIIEPRSRVLTWPNAIRDSDWIDWTGGRASSVPTAADPRYARAIETHDIGQPPNTNTILVARLGKGTVVYTTLTFADQIPVGVPGGMRLFVNLLSASLPARRLP